MASPRISVVMPVYDRSAFLAETAASVLAQTFDDWELLIVEDGGSVRAAPLLPQKDPRIRVHRIAHGGVAAARSHGVAEARGEYIAFLDDDDLFFPGTLARRLEAAEARGGLIATQWYWSDGTRRALAGPARDLTLADVLFANPIGNSAVLVRRDLFATPAIPAGTSSIEDWALWIELAARRSMLPVLAEPTGIIRVHGLGHQSDDRARMASRRLAYFAGIEARLGALSARERQIAAMHLATAQLAAGRYGDSLATAVKGTLAAPAAAPGLVVRKALHTVRARRPKLPTA